MKILQNEYKLEISNKQKPLDSTTMAEDINKISLLLRKHLLGTKPQELQVHAAVHQTQAESQAHQVRFNYILHINFYHKILIHLSLRYTYVILKNKNKKMVGIM